MNYKEILTIASNEVLNLKNRIVNVIDLIKPADVDYAIQISRIISKLSPLIGNMLEMATVNALNTVKWENNTKWKRQDPGFPDAIYNDPSMEIKPGIEIKAWFPFATEITARFKDSVNMFNNENINVALIAWIPENILWGKPVILECIVITGKSISEARDKHYHNPPKYLVFEPEDTTNRAANLQQTNTNGYVFQMDKSNLEEAKIKMNELGIEPNYSPSLDYQRKLYELRGSFFYRLDTNFAKIDRIEHPGIVEFKTRVMNILYKGKKISEWMNIVNSSDPDINSFVEIINL